MKNLIEWIKSNPIVTACAVVSLASLVVAVYFYFIVAPKDSQARSEQLKQEAQRQQRVQNIPVPLPNKDPNAPADIHRVVVNPVVINDVSKVYTEIQSQYGEILDTAKLTNSQAHAPFLLGGDGIWPDADTTQFFDLYFDAKQQYKDHFKVLFDKERRGNKWNMPLFAASSPPTTVELERILAQSAFEYISSVGAQSIGELTQNQANQLYAEQRWRLMQELNQRARSLNLYVSLPREEDPYAPVEEEGVDGAAPAAAPPTAGGAFAFGPTAGQPGGLANGEQTADYPFQIAPWADADQPPNPDQLWEGQVQLWVMRDVMWTIHRFNNVGGTVVVDGQEEFASVVNSPVKRLLRLDTLPGYVGLHNTWAVLGGASANNAGASGFQAPPAFGAGGGAAQPAVGSAYPDVPADLVAELTPKPVTENAIEHFGITPTGRVSNSVFDVRHSRLTIDIEARRLPAFIEALNQTNFMTVVKSEVTDLDEYEMLQQGYVYGFEDIVQADLVIESLWFRNWTDAYMPKIVKEKLLIIAPEGQQTGQQFQDGR